MVNILFIWILRYAQDNGFSVIVGNDEAQEARLCILPVQFIPCEQ